MKKSIYIIILLIISTVSLTAQSFNKEIIEDNTSPMLLGKINQQGLSEDAYSEWFLKNFDEYSPKQDIIEAIKTQLNQYTITLFMGTWCGDSKREVPRFYKVLETLSFPIDRLTTVAVNNQRDSYKQSPGGEHEGLNIHRVPTFIFHKDGKEINRIVESPKTTLEKDILAILLKNYSPKYQSVALMHTLLNEKGEEYLTKKAKKIVPEFKKKTQSLYELNTYANVLFYDHKYNEAIAVLKFNTLLFPKEANTYISLANKYIHLEDKVKAIEYYEKSLKLANNEEIHNKIKELRIASNQE